MHLSIIGQNHRKSTPFRGAKVQDDNVIVYDRSRERLYEFSGKLPTIMHP